jgi:hypothetical protein
VLVVGAVLWLLPRRELARVGDRQEPEAPTQAPAAATALERLDAAEDRRDQPVRVPADDPVSSVDDDPAPPGAEQTGMQRYFHGQVFDALAWHPLPGVRAVVPKTKRKARPDELAAEEISHEVVTDGEGRFELPLATKHGVELGYLLTDGYGLVSFMVDEEHGSRASALVLDLLPCGGVRSRGHGRGRKTGECEQCRAREALGEPARRELDGEYAGAFLDRIHR